MRVFTQDTQDDPPMLSNRTQRTATPTSHRKSPTNAQVSARSDLPSARSVSSIPKKPGTLGGVAPAPIPPKSVPLPRETITRLSANFPPPPARSMIPDPSFPGGPNDHEMSASRDEEAFARIVALERLLDESRMQTETAEMRCV
jgi:hypothetical protein